MDLAFSANSLVPKDIFPVESDPEVIKTFKTSVKMVEEGFWNVDSRLHAEVTKTVKTKTHFLHVLF